MLNQYGKYLPRRRVIEGGLIALGVLLGLLSVSGPISRLLQRADAPGGLDLSGITSLLTVVVVIALAAGIAYAFVAIPSQTQLQEDLPEDVRGRVFGILNMLVSVASFLPIIIVGPISDLIGTTLVLVAVALIVLVTRHRVRAGARAAARDRKATTRRIRTRSIRSRRRSGPTDRPGTSARSRPARRASRAETRPTMRRPVPAGPSDPADRA